MSYKPLSNNLTIKKSNINGLGLFATQYINAFTDLGISHIPNDEFENGYIRTPLGGFVNHNNYPNCELKVDDKGYFKLVTMFPIQTNEELTLRYNLYKV